MSRNKGTGASAAGTPAWPLAAWFREAGKELGMRCGPGQLCTWQPGEGRPRGAATGALHHHPLPHVKIISSATLKVENQFGIFTQP